MPRVKKVNVPMREAHIIQYLTRYGPSTYEELARAVPGDIGGRADRVVRRLIREGRLEARYIKDYEK